MHILLTGASSFTGAHFAQTLVAAGHQVTATFRGARDGYTGLRQTRIDGLAGAVETVWNTSFGDDRFVDLVAASTFDVLCHHGAEMTDYRSWDYDALAASAANTRNSRKVLQTLLDRGGRALVVTGSVFEPFEGVGDPQQRAFSPYGLAKHISFELLRLEADRLGLVSAEPGGGKLALGKFVISNPFGPGEEFRFTSFLAREWAAGRTPVVNTPDYIRDNIHVSLLADHYADFVGRPFDGYARSTPSGYVESQGAFARRLALEIEARLGWSCPVGCAAQTDFAEPLMRTNPKAAGCHPADDASLRWSESAAWDALAAYYQASFA